MSERELLDKMPTQMAKYANFYERCSRLYRPPENPDRVRVTVALGAAGTGKTLYARGPLPNYMFQLCLLEFY